MGTLDRYLARQNLAAMLTCLGVGVGLYLLSDVFDRLDDFLEAGLGLGTVLTYFVVKIPLIVSQILPAVFLVSMVIQLGVMARNRELLALRAGGVTFGRICAFFLAYAGVWCLAQLAVAQIVGVYGEAAANRIWAEEVRQRKAERMELPNLWFREGPYVVELARAWPGRGEAEGVMILEVAQDVRSIHRIITARKVEAEPGAWTFSEVQVLDPVTYAYAPVDSLTLPLTQDLRSFLAVDPNVDPASLPMWKLSRVMERLAASGSNVERLRTAWHMKWSYAFSLAAMALIALALATLWENVYLNLGLSLALTFAYYAVFMLGVTAGQKGLLPAVLGAWLGNILFAALAGARLWWVVRPSLPGLLPRPRR
ncbi:MAG: LptF/LptG family permease [Thermodesulfobacteriota bacterium]